MMPSSDRDSQISVASFFCGCGGMDLGFLGGFGYLGDTCPRLPFEIVEACDYDGKCIDTYDQNIGHRYGHSARLRDLSDPEAVAMVPAARVLIGGFPCQDFSSCGPKRGLGSERGRLYNALRLYMAQNLPELVIAENVPNLARMGGGEVLRAIVQDLEHPPGDMHYRFQVWNLFAPEYGVPQNRRRLFLVGVRGDIEGAPLIPAPTHSGRHRPISWAIGDLESGSELANHDQYFKASRAKRGNGQGDERSVAMRPAYTVRANAKSRVQFHYRLERRLTVRECARLQTFPDWFEFPHSATTNVMQIGNAVPPLLAFRVAQSARDFLMTAHDGAPVEVEHGHS